MRKQIKSYCNPRMYQSKPVILIWSHEKAILVQACNSNGITNLSHLPCNLHKRIQKVHANLNPCSKNHAQTFVKRCVRNQACSSAIWAMGSLKTKTGEESPLGIADAPRSTRICQKKHQSRSSIWYRMSLLFLFKLIDWDSGVAWVGSDKNWLISDWNA